MSKRLFSIHCTTCQARLAIYSGSAVGAILECPRCQSMVLVTPPPGWQPAPSSSPVTSPAGPPPLDRVATVPLMLELDPSGSLLNRLLRQSGIAWGAAALATLAVVTLLVFTVSRSATPDKRPATAVAGGGTAQIPTSPGPQSRGVREQSSGVTKQSGGIEERSSGVKEFSPRPLAGEGQGVRAAGSETASNTETSLTSQQVSSMQPVDAANVKPAEPDPFSAIADGKVDKAAAERVEIKKAPPVRVDVAARLAAPVAELQLTDVPLAKAVELLAAMGSLPVSFDVDAMAQLGVSPREPISVQLRATTVGKALQAAAAEKGLAATVENGQVLIGAPAEYRETLHTVRYTVADLTGDDKAHVAELAAVVQQLVAPKSWQPAGGRGTIVPDRGAMVVAQSGEVHQQVLIFCEKLRNARRTPLRSRESPERFALTTQRDQAQKMLDRPVTANFHEPAPLAEILAFLAETARADILVNRAVLAAADTSDHVEAALAATKQPLGAALTELLGPLGLTYRTIGPNVIQVTTCEAAEERLGLEFYPVGTWLAKQNSPLPLAAEGQQHHSPLPLGEGQGVRGAALAERLKARVAPSAWSDVGGSGEVHFDPPSQCLIVLQSQATQAEIQGLLTPLR